MPLYPGPYIQCAFSMMLAFVLSHLFVSFDLDWRLRVVLSAAFLHPFSSVIRDSGYNTQWMRLVLADAWAVISIAEWW